MGLDLDQERGKKLTTAFKSYFQTYTFYKLSFLDYLEAGK